MALYELRGVKKYYGGKLALDIPALTLEGSGLYALCGPNAAGKTTLLNLLAFLDKATEGEVIFHNGQPVRGKHHIRETTLVMQNPYLFNTTVLKNVLCGLKFRSLRKAGIGHMVVPVMKRLKIWDLKDRHVKSLSGGERKRVALARALVLDARVLLLDEPAANVDEANSGLIEEAICAAKEKNGKVVIMATHDSGQARRVDASIIRLVDGRVLGADQ